MYEFLDSYIPQPGSTDPYGRPEVILQKFPLRLLPDMIWKLPHVKDFLLNYNHETTKN